MRRVLVVFMAVAASILGGAAATATTLEHVAAPKPIKVEDTCACGGYVYVVWTIIYYPGGDRTQPARCLRHWSNGVETDTLCN